MIYYLNPKELTNEEIVKLLGENKQIKFVSLVAVDLGNNRTDERIPINQMLDDIDVFLRKGIQTDGSSVVLPKIADINNAKVDIIPDLKVKWIVDYNYMNIDKETGLPVGTLLIPSFLVHEEKMVCSRSILYRAVETLDKKVCSLVNSSSMLKDDLSMDSELEKAEFTLATELEFWVKSPDHRANEEILSTSQTLKEQYWKRTIGTVRTAIEESLEVIGKFGYEPEMGHKEVGGVPSKLKSSNNFTHVMEQIEIDWKYDTALQAADNEMFIKDVISDVFNRYGLTVTFKAKPIEGVAGSGEHHHMGISGVTKKGKRVNVFAPKNMTKDYLGKLGYGALMGMLKNYPAINPFVSSTNDSFNRLKPGFEAPVCTVCSLGHKPEIPSRNRTVLVGLVRDVENPMATRFELRAPNPNSNTYLTAASSAVAMLEGMEYASNKSERELLKELSKKYGEEAEYLRLDRAYRSELDVFEEFDDISRDKYFDKPPKTVWQNYKNYRDFSNKDILLTGGVFTPSLIESYFAGILSQWATELKDRILAEFTDLVKGMTPIHGNELYSELDNMRWEEIMHKKVTLLKDTTSRESLFTQLLNAIERKDYSIASEIQVNIQNRITDLKHDYRVYKKNIIQ